MECRNELCDGMNFGHFINGYCVDCYLNRKRAEIDHLHTLISELEKQQEELKLTISTYLDCEEMRNILFTPVGCVDKRRVAEIYTKYPEIDSFDDLEKLSNELFKKAVNNEYNL